MRWERKQLKLRMFDNISSKTSLNGDLIWWNHKAGTVIITLFYG